MPSNDALFEMIVLAAMTSFFMSNPDRCCVIVSHGLSPSFCAKAYSDSAGIAVYYWTFLKRSIARLAEVCRRLGHLIWRASEDFADNGCGVKLIATTAQSFRFYFLVHTDY